MRIRHCDDGEHEEVFAFKYSSTAILCSQNHSETDDIDSQQVSAIFGAFERMSDIKFCCRRKYEIKFVSSE